MGQVLLAVHARLVLLQYIEANAAIAKSQSRYFRWSIVFIKNPLFILVFPSSITLSDSTENYTSSDGISCLVEGEVRRFNCSVPSINPGASFSWLVDGRGLSEMTYSNQDEIGMDGLTTSTSQILLTATWFHHGKLLKCQASNREGHPGISISVGLRVYGKRG